MYDTYMFTYINILETCVYTFMYIHTQAEMVLVVLVLMECFHVTLWIARQCVNTLSSSVIHASADMSMLRYDTEHVVLLAYPVVVWIFDFE